jgi:hypothetical protein
MKSKKIVPVRDIQWVLCYLPKVYGVRDFSCE